MISKGSAYQKFTVNAKIIPPNNVPIVRPISQYMLIFIMICYLLNELQKYNNQCHTVK